MAEIGNLAVRLSLDNAQFERSVKSMNTTLKAMGQEIRTLQNRGKDWGASIEGLRAKQDAYGRLLEGQQTKVRKLADAYEKAKAEQGEHADKTQRLAEQLNRATAEMTRTERELSEITAELNRQEAELARSQTAWARFGEAAQAAGAKLKAIGDKMTSIGKDLTMKVTAPLAAMGAGIVKVGMDFDSQMSKVAAVSGATGKDFDALRDKAQELGASTKFTATQAAEGFEYLALAGYDAGQQLAAIDGLLALAAAANMDLGQAADITTDVMSAFGLEASKAGHAADVFAYAQANANTNVEQIGEAMKYAAPMANQMGWSLEETTAAMMKLADNGLKGSIAGQAFASSLGRLAKPTKEMRKTMDELGLSFFDANDNMKSLPDIVAHLEDRFDGLTMKQKSAAITTLFGAEAYKHWAILLESGSDILNTHTKSLENADGTAKKMADTMVDNLGGSLLMLKSAVEGLMIQFSDLIKDDLKALAEWLTKIAGKFAELDDSTKKAILVIGALAAAVGPLLVVGGILTSSIGSIVTALGAASTAVANAGGAAVILGKAFTALTGPIGLTVTALAGIGIGAVAVAKNMSKDALPSVQHFGKGVSEATQQALSGFFDLSEKASLYVTDMYITSTTVTSDMANQLITQFGQMNTQIVEGMKQRNTEQISNLQEFFAFSSALTSEEEEKALTSLQQRHEREIEEQNIMNERVKAIIQTAADEKRELTEREHEIINNYNRMMKENAVQTFSESEIEQKIILERMKENASIISAEQAAEVVKNAVKQKEDVVKEAEETYEKRMAQIIKMRDESGVISAEQADKMIAEATKAKDQTIYLAEEQHQKIVETAQQQAEEHVDKVNWETGEILSKWEVFKNKHSEIFDKIEEYYTKVTDSLKEITSTAYAFIKKTVDKYLGEVVSFVKEQLDKLENFWDENGEQIWGIVKLYFGYIKTNIETVMGIIQGIFEIVWPIISNTVKVAWETIKLVVGSALDTILGIINIALKILQGDWQGAWEELGKIGQKMMDNFKSYLKGVNLEQIGKDIINGLIKGISSMKKSVWSAVEGIADGITSTAKKILGIKSPSRVFKQIGLWTGEGMVIGLDQSSAKVNKAMENIGDGILAVSEKYQKEYSNMIDEFNRKNEDKNDKTLEKIYKIRNNAAKKKRALTVKEQQDIALLEASYRDNKLKADRDFNKKYMALVEKSEKEYLEVIKSYIDDKKSLDQLSILEEAAIWEQSMELFSEGTTERIKAQQEYKKAVEAVNKEITAINADYSSQVLKINEDLIKSEEALNKAYEDAVSKRESSLKNFKGLFDEFKVELNRTGDELMANLSSQIVHFEGWQREIEYLATRAIDDGLLEELRQMGPSALPELVALNRMTDSQLTQYSEMYRKKSKLAREQAEKEHIGMKNDTEKQIKGLRENANKQLDTLQKEWNSKIKSLTKDTSSELSSLEQIGRDAGNGLLKGLSSTSNAIKTKALDIANSVKKTIQSALDIHSPSRVTMGFGVNINEGLIKGMEQSQNRLQQAMNNVYGSLASSAEKSTRNASASMPTSTTSTIDNSRYMQPRITIINQVPNASPSELARKAIQAQRQLAMEWGV